MTSIEWATERDRRMFERILSSTIFGWPTLYVCFVSLVCIGLVWFAQAMRATAKDIDEANKVHHELMTVAGGQNTWTMLTAMCNTYIELRIESTLRCTIETRRSKSIVTIFVDGKASASKVFRGNEQNRISAAVEMAVAACAKEPTP